MPVYIKAKNLQCKFRKDVNRSRCDKAGSGPYNKFLCYRQNLSAKNYKAVHVMEISPQALKTPTCCNKQHRNVIINNLGPKNFSV